MTSDVVPNFSFYNLLNFGTY